MESTDRQQQACHLYSYEGEHWPKLDKLEKASKGQWLLYLDDMYFGKVIDKTEDSLTLLVTNFRMENASYRRNFSSQQLYQLRCQPEDVLVDPQISATFPSLHSALVRAFAIWRNIDGLAMEAKRQADDPGQVIPQLFRECGQAFGKWAASGYIRRKDAEQLLEIRFVERIGHWYTLQNIALRDDVEEALLEAIDKIRTSPFIQVDQKLADIWVMVQAGFFEYTPENCKKARSIL